MNYFTSKINTIRDQTVTMQLPAAVSHQIVHFRSPQEQFHSFSTIGEKELYKRVKSAKPTTCMLDPILEIDRYGFFYNQCRCLAVRRLDGRYVLPIVLADILKFSPSFPC